jgi:hypothetical protein
MKRTLLTSALLITVLAAASCGSDSSNRRLLSNSQAGELRATLNQIEQEVSAGNCSGAGDRVAALETQIDAIRRLDRKARSALRSSARRLDALVSSDCQTQTTTTPTKTTPTTPQEGTTGTTGATGTTGEQGKHKNEKKGKVPPGQAKKESSGQTGGAGGPGGPGEGNADGGQSP